MSDDVEIIVADDGSYDGQRVEEFIGDFGLDYNVIYMDPHDKWYTNPCIPNNKAISHATGEIIILQNPECFHVTDILKHTYDNLKETDYFSYGCYSLGKNSAEKFNEIALDEDYTESISSFCQTLPNSAPVGGTGNDGWYNHTVYRPTGYHFLSAMYKSQMDNLGGFDERYARGIGFDDDEFLFRIKLMGLDVKILDQPFCFHQFHYASSSFERKAANDASLLTANIRLFQHETQNSKEWRVNQ